MAASSGSSPQRAFAMVVLPDPDSPTTAIRYGTGAGRSGTGPRVAGVVVQVDGHGR